MKKAGYLAHLFSTIQQEPCDSKLVSTDMGGATYSLLLHHCDFQFMASYTDGTIVLSEDGEFSSDDGALLQKLLRHLETASKRALVRRHGRSAETCAVLVKPATH
jgi:hypothetical protein